MGTTERREDKRERRRVKRRGEEARKRLTGEKLGTQVAKLWQRLWPVSDFASLEMCWERGGGVEGG